jgi:hypothetical protein
MLPAWYIVEPRKFREACLCNAYIFTKLIRFQANIFMVRLTSFPILLAISWYERQAQIHNSTDFMEIMAATVKWALDHLPWQWMQLSEFYFATFRI